METQSSSKARIKNDTFGDNGFKALFEAYSIQAPEVFKLTCIDFIQNSSAKASTKESFIRDISKIKNKDKLLQSVTNYMLAGEGKKV